MQLSVRGTLARQSLLVSGLCVAADVGFVFVADCAPSTAAQTVTLAVLIGADLCLAGPARLSGFVAVAQGLIRMLGVLTFGPTASGNTAGLMIAGYRAGAWLRGTPAWLTMALTTVAIGLSRYVANGFNNWPIIPLMMAESGLLPWLVGRYTTTRRAYLAELEQRAEQERRDAKEAVSKAVVEERASIARDLHDVIAHHVSAINVHAGAARLIMAGDQQNAKIGGFRDDGWESEKSLGHGRAPGTLLDLLKGRPAPPGVGPARASTKNRRAVRPVCARRGCGPPLETNRPAP
ncbi:histidine kinase [Kutzneria sp. 744]|uniref:histidine kinase n=1 Tax=Kutzneria sp. (strain 744) TaxID=345341 RepID=UPI0003EECCB4|nr:histidine kinase [Kutzneria sp. 744]EWM17408.1 two-component system sensor kinase [Kutzneria sp. 744]